MTMRGSQFKITKPNNKSARIGNRTSTSTRNRKVTVTLPKVSALNADSLIIDESLADPKQRERIINEWKRDFATR